jgi:hypothetical protein
VHGPFTWGTGMASAGAVGCKAQTSATVSGQHLSRSARESLDCLAGLDQRVNDRQRAGHGRPVSYPPDARHVDGFLLRVAGLAADWN